MKNRVPQIKKRGRINFLRSKILFTLLLFSTLQAFPQDGKVIGKVEDFYNLLDSKIAPATGKMNAQRSVQSENGTLNIVLNHKTSAGEKTTFIGTVDGRSSSNAYFTFSNGKVEGSAVIPDKEEAYTYSSDEEGNVIAKAADIHELICVEMNEKEEAQALSAQAPPAGSYVYNLQSFPGAQAVVLLDFDGQYVSGTYWNGGNPIDAQPANMSESVIEEIWKMISEDFRPFNLNITTNESIYLAAPVNRRMRCIFTPTNTAAPGAGGVAYINSFNWNNDTPCWVFNGGVKGAGEAGSHEVGHTLGLGHDGRTNPSEGYFRGHGNWAPIMGVGYYENVVQWSKGEYNYANNTQDDIAIITNSLNGFGFRTDEAGNTIGSSKALAVSSTGSVSASANSGIITQRTDVDVYSFTTSGGTISLSINPAPAHPNLDILARITNSAGTQLASSNPTGLSTSFTVNLSAGTYYLHLDGTGSGNPATDGYSDYASIGEYSISGTIPVGPPVNQNPVVSITSPSNGATYTQGANIAIQASASDPDGTVSKVEFFRGSTLLFTDFTSPYSYTISNASAGNYQLKAVATDNNGATGSSAVVNVTVNTPSNQSPIVSISSPANNATFNTGSSFTVTASASDPDGTISLVEFYNGNTFLSSDNTSPYQYSVSNAAAGTYLFKAVATDNQGAKTTSATITVNVMNTSSFGVNGPSCIEKGVTYTFTLNPEAPASSVSWWIGGDGTAQVDPSDSKKVYITAGQWASSSVTVNAGANLAASPWYKQYTKTVQVGGCAATPQASVVSAPHPFNDQTTISVNNSEKILSAKLMDLNGREVLNTGSVEATEVTLGQDLKPGMYILHVTTETGSYKRTLIKTE